MKCKIKKVDRRKFIKLYFTDHDLLYGSGKNINKQIVYKRIKLLHVLRNTMVEELHRAGLPCIKVVIVRGSRIMFNVHGKWFLPYYNDGVPKCPERLSGCKEWSEKCISTVLSDKNMEKFNKVMEKINKDKLLLSTHLKEGGIDAHM